MKLMIDASLQSVGGGVQVAVNFINNILKDCFITDLLVVVSPQVDKQILNKDKLGKNYIVVENTKGFLKFKQGSYLKKLEHDFKPDLVFIVFGPAYWKPMARSVQGFALPLMVYSKTLEIINKSWNKKIKSKILHNIRYFQIKKNYDFFLVETETFKSLIVEKFGLKSDKVFVIENSFNQNLINDQISLVNKKDSYSFFVPTAYYPHKNLEILIDVAKILKDKYLLTVNFNFLLPENLNEWKSLKVRAKDLNINDQFRTYGVIKNTEMHNKYKVNDFVILPTLAEVSTAVYPETFASGKVLFTSDLDFAQELCGNAAIFFNPHSPEDIAEKIFLVLNDTDLQEEILRASQFQLKSKYISPEEKWDKQKNLIQTLIKMS